MQTPEQKSLGRYAIGKTADAHKLIKDGELGEAANVLQQLASILRFHHENYLIEKNELAS
jgi:hypothetical protein